MNTKRGSTPGDATRSQIRRIAAGEGLRQRRSPRHSQQYQLHAPVRPSDGTAERPPLGLGIGLGPAKR
ncbi:MAG TPA: hypothetical protein VMS56_06805 [Thermoanaerobaculia bacterium]|nr:hypothetical protein [Thermoanaerobaculia bacterium]